jgi:perosamine synthetase
MKALLAIAKARHLHLVEDCAEAFGSRYREKQVGGLGVMGTFSFFGNKTITTGEGGMVVTCDEALAKVVRHTKGQGVSPTREYFFERLGYNYRMTNIEAAIGLAQLERAPELIERKRRNAALYHERLSPIQGLSLPVERDYALNTYWMYSIIVEDSFAVSRDELRKHLKANGVETRPFFHPCHLLPMYQRKQKLAVTENLGARGINLPSATTLTTKQIDHIAKLIRECTG